MSRKSDSASDRAASSKELKTFRVQIDKLDLQILKLINERAELAAEIGRVKTENNDSVFSPAREEEVIANVLSRQPGAARRGHHPGHLPRDHQRLARAAEDRQGRLPGAGVQFSHLAAVCTGSARRSSTCAVGSIAAVFEEVNRGHVDFGVVPLENSTDGRVADTLDMFIRHAATSRSAREVRLRIHHNLLANCEQPEIRRVYSKPQALSQCRNWLAQERAAGDAARGVEHGDAPPSWPSTEPGAAAVASRQAAVQYGLRILFSNIEDSPHNETRFAVIGPHERRPDGQRQDGDHVP